MKIQLYYPPNKWNSLRAQNPHLETERFERTYYLAEQDLDFDAFKTIIEHFSKDIGRELVRDILHKEDSGGKEDWFAHGHIENAFYELSEYGQEKVRSIIFEFLDDLVNNPQSEWLSSERATKNLLWIVDPIIYDSEEAESGKVFDTVQQVPKSLRFKSLRELLLKLVQNEEYFTKHRQIHFLATGTLLGLPEHGISEELLTKFARLDEKYITLAFEFIADKDYKEAFSWLAKENFPFTQSLGEALQTYTYLFFDDVDLNGALDKVKTEAAKHPTLSSGEWKKFFDSLT